MTLQSATYYGLRDGLGDSRFKCEGCHDGARLPRNLVPAGRVNDIGAPIYVCGDCSPPAQAPASLEFRVGMTVTTKRGVPVEIVHVLPPGKEAQGDAIIGIASYSDGTSEICTWQRNGRFTTKRESPLDLLPPVIRATYPAEYKRMTRQEFSAAQPSSDLPLYAGSGA